MEGLVCCRTLWITLLVILFTLLSVSADAEDSNSSDGHEIEDTTDSSSLIPKTQVKRNVAYWARSGNRKFFLPSRSSKRNVAWLARTGGRDTVLFPTSNKRLVGDATEGDDLENEFEPYEGEDFEYLDEESPNDLEKRNIASLVNSRTIPSFIRDYKRHIGPVLGRYRGRSTGTYGQLYDRPDKRYFASLLKSETPLASMYSRMNRRFGYFGGPPPTKRFFSSLLENDYGVPGEDDISSSDKRGFASLLKSDNPYKGKRSFASLLKSDSGIGMSGKRYYSSLLDDTKNEDKRFVASLLKSKALQDVNQGPSSRILGSIYDRRGSEIEKRHFSSLINRNSPYSDGKHITKRHVGSLRDPSKRFYGSLLDNSRDDDRYDKRSFGSLLKSSSYNQANKKNVGSALRYRPRKRSENDGPLTEEELQLDALNKRFLGSLLDSTTKDKLYGHSPGKRHFGSLLDNRDVRSEVLFDEEAYPLEGNDDDKRHVASIFDGRSAPGKRFLGSLMDSETPYGNSEKKRFLGSAINSRMSYKNEGKRFLGSAINSRMNFKNDDNKRFAESVYDADSDIETNKRFVGSVVQSREANKNEEKRFFASVLDNTRKANNNGVSADSEKRFLGSTLKSKSDDIRSKRSITEDDEDSDEIEERNPRSADYYEENLYEPNLQDVEEFAAGDPPMLKSPVKRFLPPMARKNWFPEFYYDGYSI